MVKLQMQSLRHNLMLNRHIFLLSSLLISQVAVTAAPEQNLSETVRPSIETTHALLQGLDKVTGRVINIIAGIDEVVAFGTLKIRMVKCLKTAPEEPPESIAFLEIQEEKPNLPLMDYFIGWMFASNPSISALEHPVYDIWIKECSGQAKSETFPSSSVIPDLAPTEPYPSLPDINPEDIDEAPPILTPEAVEQEQIDALYEGLERERPAGPTTKP